MHRTDSDHRKTSDVPAGFPFRGVSMLPLLKEGKDEVLLGDCGDRAALSVGEVILFDRGGEQVLHRIIRVETEPSSGRTVYEVRGDNCMGSDRVFPEQILARMTGYVRDGRIVRTEDAGYRKYVKRLLAQSPRGHRLRVRLRAYGRKIASFLK